MRFVLALWVVLHHISGQGMMLEAFVVALPAALRVLIRDGYLAVQSFFILSGFVLAQSYARTVWNKRSLINYFGARLARIYPVYLFSLLVVSPFIWGAMQENTRTFETKVSLLIDYIFVLQGWKGNLHVGWNTPAWSLSCEFVFYLCFPLLLPGIKRAGTRVLALLLVVTLVVPAAMPHYGVPWDWKPIYHLSDFAAGIVASRIFDIGATRFSSRGQGFYLPAIVAGVALILHPQWMDGTYGDLNTGLRPLNVVALIGLAWGGGALARALEGPVIDFLGKASYSLYILHVPVLWWFNKWAMRRGATTTRGFASILYVALVIAASAVVFQWLEVPCNRRVRQFFRDLA